MTTEQAEGIKRFEEQQQAKQQGTFFRDGTIKSLPYDGYYECHWVENGITYKGLFHPDDLVKVDE